jgi:hypothetical protein
MSGRLNGALSRSRVAATTVVKSGLSWRDFLKALPLPGMAVHAVKTQATLTSHLRCEFIRDDDALVIPPAGCISVPQLPTYHLERAWR